MISNYFDAIHSLLREVEETQSKKIRSAAHEIVRAATTGSNIYAFGCNHSGLLSQELFYRTGGLVIINPVMAPGLSLDVRPVTLTTSMERLEGYGKEIIINTEIKQGDILIINSVSGRNSVPVEAAIQAGILGAYTIALTSMKYSGSVDSRHSSGKKLYEVCDLVIDNCGCAGDAALNIEGFPQRVAPTSTVIGAAILNAMVAEAVSIFIEKGITPPIFISSNIEGGDNHNKKVMELFKNSIKYL